MPTERTALPEVYFFIDVGPSRSSYTHPPDRDRAIRHSTFVAVLRLPDTSYA